MVLFHIGPVTPNRINGLFDSVRKPRYIPSKFGSLNRSGPDFYSTKPGALLMCVIISYLSEKTGKMRHAPPLVAALAAAGTMALLAVVSLSVRTQRAGETALTSLRSSGTWPGAPSYEPHVGDVLSQNAVRDFHPRRPGGRAGVTSTAGSVASAGSAPPLVTARTEREVSAGAASCARRRRPGRAASAWLGGFRNAGVFLAQVMRPPR